MNIYTVLIQKDTYTQIPTVVAEHEIPIIQDVHGVKNIMNTDGQQVDYDNFGKPCGTFEPEANEYERLVMKYGMEQVMKSIGNPADLRRILAPAKRTARKPKVQTEVKDTE